MSSEKVFVRRLMSCEVNIDPTSHLSLDCLSQWRCLVDSISKSFFHRYCHHCRFPSREEYEQRIWFSNSDRNLYLSLINGNVLTDCFANFLAKRSAIRADCGENTPHRRPCMQKSRKNVVHLSKNPTKRCLVKKRRRESTWVFHGIAT